MLDPLLLGTLIRDAHDRVSKIRCRAQATAPAVTVRVLRVLEELPVQPTVEVRDLVLEQTGDVRPPGMREEPAHVLRGLGEFRESAVLVPDC